MVRPATDPDSPLTTLDGEPVLVSAADALEKLPTFSEEKLAKIAQDSTGFYTPAEGLIRKSASSVVADCKLSMDANNNYRLLYQKEPLEIVSTIMPRSSFAFNNGPGGNYVHADWRGNPSVWPDGVQLSDSRKGVYVKTTLNSVPGLDAWTTNVFDSTFSSSPRQFEYSISGTPVPSTLGTMRTLFSEIDKKVATWAASINKKKKEAHHGPNAGMWLQARRPYLVPAASFLLDEGRMSEFDEEYDFISKITGHDLRTNRVPEVLVRNRDTNTDVEISFHGIHMFPSSSVINMTMVPYIYITRGEVAWDFRLVRLHILGKRAFSIMASPNKLVVKRKAPELDLEDEEPTTASKSR